MNDQTNSGRSYLGQDTAPAYVPTSDEKTMAILSHVLTLFFWILPPLIIYLLKKDESSFTIKMIKNVDIAYEFGKIKTTDQLSIGFALETNDEVTNAMHKLARKNFDIVILNSLNEANAAFGVDTNKITILQKDLTQVDFPTQSKKQVAEDILSVTCNLYKETKRMVAEVL